ncbi:MAG: formylglycine-generating enzyme family protein [Acidobacteria bacterium]|nr:formylglycine-generating enzyme family protein [Acidobacteriota bacterium]
MSKYEVTNEQYKKFLNDNPGYVLPSYLNQRDFNDPGQPVVGVSWYDAVAYCDWLSAKTKGKYRLPTEAEWEKAARGIDSRTYPWGNSDPDIYKANFMQQFNKPLLYNENPQGSSVYGLMNMAGNVYEWCSDWYGENYYNNGDNRNPVGFLEGTRKIVRGGSWRESAFFLRCAARNSYPPETKNEFIGFRVVRVPEN